MLQEGPQSRYPALITVVIGDAHCQSTGEALAAALGGAPWVAGSLATPLDTPYGVLLTEGHMQLFKTHSQEKPLEIDFAAPLWANREGKGGEGELLLKAVGWKRSSPPSLWDVTAGFGRDAYALASRGCPVVCFERSPLVAAMLQGAIDRAGGSVVMTCIPEDSHIYMETWLASRDSQRLSAPDVIVVDPMFPAQKKSAQVKKPAQWLQDLVGKDSDSAGLLGLARQIAKRRVVVKRPKGAEPLAGVPPSGAVTGKACRFDIYSTSSAEA